MQTYKKGIYGVTVEEKGAITVKQGDWVSKYSAAIYNDFTKLSEFGRKVNGSSIPTVIPKPDEIYANETIYHLPDYWEQHKPSSPRQKVSPPAKRKLTPAEKQIIIATLKSDFHLKGDNWKVVGNVLDYIGTTDNVLAIAEITGALEVGTYGAAISGGAAAFGFFATLLSPVGFMRELMNSNESGLKLYGLRAVAYTITAWTYSRPKPTGSNRILARINGLPLSTIAKYKQTWLIVSASAEVSLQNEARKRKMAEDSLKILYRSLSDNNPRVLCQLLMKGLSSKLDTIQKINWDLNTIYPE